MGNRIEFLETWFAVASLGGVEVPLNPELVGARLLFLLNHSRARVAVVEPEVAARIDELAPELDHLQHVVVVEGAARPPSRVRPSLTSAPPMVTAASPTRATSRS